MTLNNETITSLMQFISSVTPDDLTCDGCLDLVPELAEAQRSGLPLSEALEAVKNHMHNCPCCAIEYEAFLEALAALDCDDL